MNWWKALQVLIFTKTKHWSQSTKEHVVTSYSSSVCCNRSYIFHFHLPFLIYWTFFKTSLLWSFHMKPIIYFHLCIYGSPFSVCFSSLRVITAFLMLSLEAIGSLEMQHQNLHHQPYLQHVPIPHSPSSPTVMIKKHGPQAAWTCPFNSFLSPRASL